MGERTFQPPATLLEHIWEVKRLERKIRAKNREIRRARRYYGLAQIYSSVIYAGVYRHWELKPSGFTTFREFCTSEVEPHFSTRYEEVSKWLGLGKLFREIFMSYQVDLEAKEFEREIRSRLPGDLFKNIMAVAEMSDGHRYELGRADPRIVRQLLEKGCLRIADGKPIPTHRLRRTPLAKFRDLLFAAGFSEQI